MKSKEDTLGKILSELKRQNSYSYNFSRGIVYGIGFFIGSAIIAVMILGAIAPTLSKLDIVRQIFNDGTDVIQQNYTQP